MQYMIKAYDGKNMLERRLAVRPRHLENMAKVPGKVICAGGLLDGEGKMMVVESLGYAGVAKTYDANGVQIGTTYLDPSGNSMQTAAGYNSVEKAFDENGRVIVERFVDGAGNAVIAQDKGYAIVTHEYDEKGQEIYNYFWDGGEVSRSGYSDGIMFVFDLSRAKTCGEGENILTAEEMLEKLK